MKRPAASQAGWPGPYRRSADVTKPGDNTPDHQRQGQSVVPDLATGIPDHRGREEGNGADGSELAGRRVGEHGGRTDGRTGAANGGGERGRRTGGWWPFGRVQVLRGSRTVGRGGWRLGGPALDYGPVVWWCPRRGLPVCGDRGARRGWGVAGGAGATGSHAVEGWRPAGWAFRSVRCWAERPDGGETPDDERETPDGGR